MNDTDKLDQAFRSALALPDGTEPNSTAFGSTPEWDSVGHLQLLATIEEDFGVTLASEDVAEMVDYAAVRHILEEKYGASS